MGLALIQELVLWLGPTVLGIDGQLAGQLRGVRDLFESFFLHGGFLAQLLALLLVLRLDWGAALVLF